jgi:uncharacterized protein YkwD
MKLGRRVVTGFAIAALVAATLATTRAPEPRGSTIAASRSRLDVAAAQTFERFIAGERSERGLRRLVVSADLFDRATAHTIAMADAGKIFHSSDEALADSGPPGSSIGENVGQIGTSATRWPEQLHASFMASPSHRSIILDPGWYRFAVAVVIRDEVAYVTELFDDQHAKAPSPAPKCSPLLRVGCSYRLVPS